ncbi:MAG: ribonuclease R [Mycoplasma sp.]|nr:ribonuclease R [Mycoplasma sp.]
MFSKEQTINYLNINKRSSFIDIVKSLKVPSSKNKEFSKFLNELKKNGDIAYSKKDDKYFIPTFIGNFDVDYKVNSRGNGFCFLALNDDKEISIPIFSNYLNALKNDNININVYKDDQDDFYFGVQIKINSRKNEFIHAQIDQNLNLIPILFNSQMNFYYDKTILKANTYARFKISKITANDIYLELDKTLDFINQPYSDINLLVDISGVRNVFSDEVLNETKEIPNEVENINEFNRKDLSNKLIVTIDGEKTKDFDDAISVEKSSNNTYILGVHIADVAYYVKENSFIDQEAQDRGTSIYLIDKVIPMLPEKLSNGICSLNPNEKRFTLTLECEIDSYGNVLNKKLYPALIESKYRLTYNQVANMDNESFIQENTELATMLKTAYELSNIIGKNKVNDGYIDFEIEEPIIELDKNTGKVIAIKKRERLSSEILIENFMVFANETVSQMISDLHIPSIYRIHDAPDLEKIDALKSFVKSLGLSTQGLVQSTDPRVFQMFVNNIKEKRFDNLIKMSLLRTMQKAKYSSNNIGHFGLASKYYSHFTSPIRRYPDLLLHRIIWEVMFKNNKTYSIDNAHKIESIAAHSSLTEIKATDLERKVNDMKKAEFYENLIGTTKDAIIVSIQKFGIFVDFEDSTNALIHISTLTDSNDYVISNDHCTLTVKNTNYKIGQKLKVKIISTSNLEGKISAIIA